MGASTPDGRNPLGRRPDRFYVGDVQRCIRENLGSVYGRVVMLTITAPGQVAVCPCCERSTRVQLRSRGDVAAWNVSAPGRLRRLNARIRTEMWRRHGCPPPRVVVAVAQRQARGADHRHNIALARTDDQMRRVRLYVALWRELHVEYGLGFIDDPEHRKADGSTRVYESAGKAGGYLGSYLGGGQLERLVAASDRGWRAIWVSPVLLARTGYTLARCRWIRQGWHVSRGSWGRGVMGRLVSRLPSWWHDDTQRAWVAAVLGWDGSPGSLVGA